MIGHSRSKVSKNTLPPTSFTIPLRFRTEKKKTEKIAIESFTVPHLRVSKVKKQANE